MKSKCTGLKSLDQKLVEMILDEVVPKSSTGVKFADVSGQEKVKYRRYISTQPNPKSELRCLKT